VSALADLDEAGLIEILTKPKNALIRQYQKLFEWEHVRLRFTEGALQAIAALALERKIGARGLRMILEDLMLDLMYDLPGAENIPEFVVTEEMVKKQQINVSTVVLEKAG